jgi:hypothetical protein
VTREELRWLSVGAVATVPTPFDDRFDVDYGRMAAATEHWIEAGLVAGKAVIKVAAVMGGGPAAWRRRVARVAAHRGAGLRGQSADRRRHSQQGHGALHMTCQGGAGAWRRRAASEPAPFQRSDTG